MVVYDKQANGAAPVIGDILTATSMSGVNNLANRDRFIVYADRAGWVEVTDKTIEPVNVYLKVNLEETFNGTGASAAAINTGALYLISMGNLATGVTAPVVTCTARVRFTDS